MKLLALLAIALLSTCFSPRAKSDDSNSVNVYQLSIEELQKVKVVTSTRTSEYLSEVPASITVFSQRELKRMGVDFLFEILNYVPGYQTGRDNDYSGAYLFSSRGSDTGRDTTAILLLIDGVPRQEVPTGSASKLSSLMPIERIERIEVMRGPGSALYGSNAILGIINVISIKGQNAVSADIGESGRRKVQAEFNLQISGWSLDGFLSRYQDDGDRYWLSDRLSPELRSTQDPQLVENIVLRLAHANTVLTFEHSNAESEQFYSVSTINNDLNEHQQSLNHVAFKQGFFWNRFESNLQASYVENQIAYLAQGSNAGDFAAISDPPSSDPLLADILLEGYTSLVQSLNDWRINDQSSLQFGFEWQHERLTTARSLTNYNVDQLKNGIRPIAYSPIREFYSEVIDTEGRNVSGIYTQFQYQFDPMTEVLVGARYDHYEGLDDDNVSPRLVLIRHVDEYNTLKLLHGEAFRAPSLAQVYLKESLLAVRNPELKPETIRSTELIWLYEHASMSFVASAFYNTIFDRIESSTSSDGKRININSDREHSNGVELEASVQLHPNWLLRAGYTYMFKLQDSSFRESTHLASLISHFQHHDFSFNLSAYYNSERNLTPLPGSEAIDSFVVVNTKLGYRITNKAQLHLQIKNLTDDDAASSPQDEGIHVAIPYRGRETSLGFTYTY